MEVVASDGSHLELSHSAALRLLDHAVITAVYIAVYVYMLLHFQNDDIVFIMITFVNTFIYLTNIHSKA